MEQHEEIRHKRAKLEDIVPRCAPFVVLIDPCGACNFKCNFCPCNVSDFQVEERHKLMTWELFEKIADDLQAFQGQVKVINVYGFGEPLLNPRVADMVKILKEKNLSREVRITTNGSLLDEKKAKQLIDAGIDTVRVSVEALSTQGYRELCGVDIDFEKIRRNVGMFYRLSRGTKSKIAVKIVSATMDTEKDAQRFSDIFAPISDFHFIREVSPNWAEFDQMVMPQNAYKVANGCYPPSVGCREEICTFPFTDMCIHSNGVVGGCCADWKFATQYGDVRYESLADIWNGSKHRAFQIAHLERRLNSFCNACVLKTYDHIENPELLLARLKERT